MNLLSDYAVNNGGYDKELTVPMEFLHGGIATNPTCIYYNNCLHINTRVVNYTKIYSLGHGSMFSNIYNQGFFNCIEPVVSHNVTFEMFNDSNTFNYDYMYEPKGVTVLYNGLEDARLVIWNGKPYAYGTRWDKIANHGLICIYEVDNHFRTINEHIIKSPFDCLCEKNWCAVSDKPFTFIYYTNPLTIIKVDIESGNISFICKNVYYDILPRYLRGNSNLVRFDDESYICLVHDSPHIPNEYGGDDIFYRFAFVFYDNDLKPTGISKSFNFKQDLCEFSCGMDIVDDKIYIAYSELDVNARLLMLPKEEFVKLFIGGRDFDSEIDYEYFESKAYEYLKKGQLKKACVMANYCYSLKHDNYFFICMFLLSIINILPYKGDDYIYPIIDFIINEIRKYDETKELYYILAYCFKIVDDLDKYCEYKEYGDKVKRDVFPEFLNYLNVNYL